jgi:hypothetical protein
MPTPKLIAMIQTTWPHIRVGFYEYNGGQFQYIQESQEFEVDGAY